MVEAILAVATKSLVEGFVKNYVVPKLAQLAHNFSTEAKSYLNVNSTSFVAYYKERIIIIVLLIRWLLKKESRN